MRSSHWHAVIFLVAIVQICLCGCASDRSTVFTNRTAAEKASVCKVDFSEAPEMKELAERARQVGNEMYPKVLALLADDTAKLPRQFDIVFKKHTWGGRPGVTLGCRSTSRTSRRSRLPSAWSRDRHRPLHAP